MKKWFSTPSREKECKNTNCQMPSKLLGMRKKKGLKVSLQSAGFMTPSLFEERSRIRKREKEGKSERRKKERKGTLHNITHSVVLETFTVNDLFTFVVVIVVVV